jgi:hypothetical protein
LKVLTIRPRQFYWLLAVRTLPNLVELL